MLLILGIVLVSGCTQSSNSQTPSTLNPTEACNIFSSYGIGSSVACPYTNSRINERKYYLDPNFCDSSESIDSTKKPFIYFKTSYINSLDQNNMRTVYCEVASETAPKVYRYIRTNNNITHLFFSSASPCKEYNYYILPKSTEALVDIVKSEYVSGMNPEGNIMYLIETIPAQISKTSNNLIVSYERYTCV